MLGEIVFCSIGFVLLLVLAFSLGSTFSSTAFWEQRKRRMELEFEERRHLADLQEQKDKRMAELLDSNGAINPFHWKTSTYVPLNKNKEKSES